ncbi:2790_t:CDS:2 [Entrophospora sp. SA101]|nr:2790_t:CDS:2 [Entrophospora sp. SA101]
MPEIVDHDYESLPENSPLTANLIAGALAAVYTGVLNAFSRISTTEGVHTLWRGVNSVVLGAGPSQIHH